MTVVPSTWVFIGLAAICLFSLQGANAQCTKCVVDGKAFPGHSRFRLEQGCLTYRCVCRCNGSYTCPPKHTINNCPTDETATKTDNRHEATTSRPTGGSDGSDGSHGSDRSHGSDGSDDSDGSDGSDGSRGAGHSRTTSEARGGRRTQDSRHGRRNDATTARPSRRREDCGTCLVGGIERKGYAYFSLIEGCTRNRHCICWCNGTHTCDPARDETICDERDATTTLASITTAIASSQGTGGSSTGHSSGSETSEASTGNPSQTTTTPRRRTRRPQTTTQRPRQRQCKTCLVGGIERKGHAYFHLTDGCTLYSYCVCSCDGTSTCKNARESQIEGCDETKTSQRPTESTTTTTTTEAVTESPNKSCPPNYQGGDCDKGTGGEEEKSTTTTTTTTTEAGTEKECRDCMVYGKYFRSKSIFQVTDRCRHHGRCYCRCDGSWNCQSAYSRNICTTKPKKEEQTTAEPCSSCIVGEQVFQGNSNFRLERGCSEYNCKCHCDGSFNCPAEDRRNICRDTTEAPTPSACRYCSVRGNTFEPRSRFNLTEGCIFYRDCDCNCDGSWNCYGTKARNICTDSTTQSPEMPCSTCRDPLGNTHPGNATFKYVRDCVEYNCDCRCDGRWECPASRSREVCAEECRTCDVQGKSYTTGAFKHKHDCHEYSCTCNCDGSWNCPGNTSVNICEDSGCKKCWISDAEQYDGNSDFVLKRGCLKYACHCNCDGSYNCPGKDSRNVCRGEVLGGCRSCMVSETDVFRGDTDFNLRRDCTHYECRCNCDGSWQCPAQTARNICIGEIPGGCRVCQADGDVFRANTNFDLKRGCLQYKCKCNCDGSYSCPAEDSRDVCRGEVPGGCRSCIISDQEYYKGYSSFQLVKDCIQYNCRCNCDGGYFCPGRMAKRVCGFEDPNERECQQCKVSETEKFAGNSTFSLTRQCGIHRCTCKCDGSWECPVRAMRYTCNRNDGRNRGGCKSCQLGQNVFPGDSSFKFTRRCLQYNCGCSCDGNWKCDHRNPTDICERKKEGVRSLFVDPTSEGDNVEVARFNVTYEVKGGDPVDEADLGTADVTITAPSFENTTEPDSSSTNTTVTGDEGGNATVSNGTLKEDGSNATGNGTMMEKDEKTMGNDTMAVNGTMMEKDEKTMGNDTMPVNGTMMEKDEKTMGNDTMAVNGTMMEKDEKTMGNDTMAVNGTMMEKDEKTMGNDTMPVNGTMMEKDEKTMGNDTMSVNGTMMEKDEKTMGNDTMPVNGTMMEKDEKTMGNDTMSVNGTMMEKDEKTMGNDTMPVNGTMMEKDEKTMGNDTMSVNGTMMEKDEKTMGNDTMPVNGTMMEKDEKTMGNDTMSVNGTMMEKDEKTMGNDTMSVNGTMMEKDEKTMGNDTMPVNGTMMEKDDNVEGNATAQTNTTTMENEMDSMADNGTEADNSTMLGKDNGPMLENDTASTNQTAMEKASNMTDMPLDEVTTSSPGNETMIDVDTDSMENATTAGDGTSGPMNETTLVDQSQTNDNASMPDMTSPLFFNETGDVDDGNMTSNATTDDTSGLAMNETMAGGNETMAGGNETMAGVNDTMTDESNMTSPNITAVTADPNMKGESTKMIKEPKIKQITDAPKGETESPKPVTRKPKTKKKNKGSKGKKKKKGKKQCKRCTLKAGKYIKPGTGFSVKLKCYSYKKCRCYCTGKWKCQEREFIDTPYCNAIREKKKKNKRN